MAKMLEMTEELAEMMSEYMAMGVAKFFFSPLAAKAAAKAEKWLFMTEMEKAGWKFCGEKAMAAMGAA